MFTALLVIIYIAFISLGLPDSLLGSGWPVIMVDFGVPITFEGILSMTISGGTIVSSFMSSKLIAKFGTGKTTFVSVMMTAIALLGSSFAPSFVWLWVACIPLGLGAGAVDSALNNFVALHYKEKHMSWLHCFWGIGATASPFIMSMFLSNDKEWQTAYLTIGILQMVLAIALAISLPLWKKAEKSEREELKEINEKFSFKEVFKLPIVKVTLLAFFCYCGIEATTGLWGSSYLVEAKGLSPQEAARWISLFFLGITLGRLISGFISMKLTGKNMIRLGEAIIVLGILLIVQPWSVYASMAGFVMSGLGCAPIFPALLHDTPKRVGMKLSQALMGIQMAFAYVGSTFVPPVFGVIGGNTTMNVFPWFLLIFAVLMVLAVETAYRHQEKRKGTLDETSS